MKKIIIVLVMLSLCEASVVNAQEEKKPFIHKGLLRAMATITPGYMINANISTISLHGNLEYNVAENISIRGDSYYFLQGNLNNGISPIVYTHSILSGASYHFKSTGQLDSYITVEPGVSICKSNKACPPNMICTLGLEYKSSVNPIVSSAIGANYYFQNWFHLFGEARYITGKHLSDAPTPLSLNEIRFSFGLGFNLDTRGKSSNSSKND